ncbi:MAG: indole-3-glycerol phosphate synthase TrpC [Candidatus Zixiibacteriota bacterium]|nr:MAG: indole-3-glycerol phosphate synthase TrpC [candidate division Zixibacteria bacterium]
MGYKPGEYYLMNILDEIVTQKRVEVEDLKLAEPMDKLLENFPDKELNFFKDKISNKSKINIIAEIKKGSPSRGIIKEDFNPITISMQYKDGGAAALSVLTESHFFFGHYGYLEVAKKETGLPILCKDFIIDPYQMYYARYRNADAVLLIVRLLTRKQLIFFQEIAKEINLDCLVEVHNQEELEIALECSARIIGVNNRNLEDFTMSLEISERLAEMIPDDVVKVSESGIFTKEHIDKLGQFGYNSFLIGESLMKSENPTEMLKTLCQ